jgi:ribosomal protein S27AE
MHDVNEPLLTLPSDQSFFELEQAMQHGYCPKCGRTVVRKRIFQATKSGGPARSFITTAYVCIHCGYTEQYIDANGLSVIATSPEWDVVPPSHTFVQPAATGATMRLESRQTGTQPPTQDVDNCPHCGSDLVIPRVRVRLSVTVDQSGWDQLLWGPATGVVYAQICGKCGYTRLFLEDPTELYAAYQNT